MEPVKNNFPLVSIIIVNWNGGEVLRNCFRSLEKIKYPNWELVLVDNSSSDGSEKLITEYPKIEKNSSLIVNSKNLGFALANNQGYEKAKGKYLLLLNNDTKVTVDFLDVLVSKLENDPTLGIVQPKILLMDKTDYLDNAGSYLTKIGFLDHWGFLNKDGEEFNKERIIFSAKGACMLIRKNIVDRISLFDPDFISYFEESDFCWRVWLLGYKVMFVPQTKIYHKVGFTIRRLDVLYLNYHYYKNRICSLIKNLEFSNLLMILPTHIIISLGIFFLFLIRFHPRNSFVIIKAIFWNLLNLPQTLHKRYLIQSKRQKTDQEIFQDILVPINWQRYWRDYKRVEEDIDRKNTNN